MKQEKNRDVVILDFYLPDTDGLEVAKKMLRRDPDIKYWS